MTNPVLFPAPRDRLRERRVNIGGRCLAMVGSGNFSPTVILETGLGAESAEWDAVQQGIEPFARVLRYDRAGRGRSDPAPRPRTASDMVDDLHRLVERAEVHGPFVLVGHSFGGLLVRLYAHRYRADAAGLVLVDSLHEDQFEVVGRVLPPPAPDDPPALQAFRRFWTDTWRDPSANAEGIDLPTSLAQGRKLRSLGELPIQVLSAGNVVDEPLAPEPMRRRMQELHEGLQRSFLQLSPRAVHSVVAGSGHFIQRDAPRAIVAAVSSVVAAVRAAPRPRRDLAR